jgi:uncharacterized protein YbjT (DUF2867 family)
MILSGRAPCRAFAGAEVVFGEGARPETLAAACAGVERMMLVLPTEESWGALQRNAIAAARSSGVRHVVHVSAVDVGPDEPSHSLTLHHQGERELEQSGMAFTHLRANAFMQNVLNFYLPTIKASGVFYQCTGNAPMAHIDTRDIAEIAEIAVLALTQDGHRDKAYELTGPEVLRYDDAAEQLSAELGRTIRHVDLSAAEYEQAAPAAGVSAWLATELVNIYSKGYYGTGKAGHVTDTARALLGREPRSFRQFVRDHAALLAP